MYSDFMDCRCPTHYYYHVFHIEDARPRFRISLENVSDAHKLRIAWNLGVGSYPIHVWSQRLGTAIARLGVVQLGFLLYRNPMHIKHNNNYYDVHARFSVVDQYPTISFQRKMFLELINGDTRFLTGRVNPRQYNQEMRNAKMTLSPFGWGEICFRDFEAVQNNSLLLRPKMDHLETWPDFYHPHQTYVPIEWDGSNINTETEYYLDNPLNRREIISNASDLYHESLAKMCDRARLLIEWFDGNG